MNLSNTTYIELTFINDNEEIKKQIRNTVLFLYLAETNGLSILSDYLEDTQYGYTASAKPEGEIKLLRITDITEGKVNWDSVPYCDCEKPEKYLLNQDDILVARTGGTTGKSFIVKNVPSKVVYASYLIRLRIKKGNNPEFISAFLNSYTYWSQLVELKSGAAQPNVNAEKLKKIIIPKCSSEIQNRYISYLKGDFNDDVLDTRIKELLSLFDRNQALKDGHNHQLDILKKLRQQILQDAMIGKLVPQDPNDEPASKLLERIKAEKEKLIRDKKIKKEKSLPKIKLEEIPFEIPDNWVWCRLGNLIELISGQDFPPDQYSDTDNSGTPYITGASNMSDGDVLINRWTKNPKSIALKGDLLLTCKGSGVGKMAYLSINKAHIARQIMSIRSYFIPIDFIQKIVETNVYFYRKAAKSLIPGIDRDTVLSTYFPLPPLAEQNRIIVKIEKLTKLCDELEESIQQNQIYTLELLQVALKEALEQK
jgi:type I restriction enzyme, S subunit